MCELQWESIALYKGFCQYHYLRNALLPVVNENQEWPLKLVSAMSAVLLTFGLQLAARR